MAIEDRYENPVTTSSPSARDHYDIGVRHLLGSTYGAIEAMKKAIADDPDFALAHIGLARAHLTAGDMPSAKAAISAGEKLAANTTKRERQHIQAHVLLAAGDGAKTRKFVEQHIQEFPHDALVAQMGTSVFGLIAFSGCAATEAQMLAYTSQLVPHYPVDDWWIKSVHSISLCESDQAGKALELMEQSLALHPHNANGSHFKAHALYEMGQSDEGLDYLNEWLKTYDRRSVLHGHLNWHVALWALAKGDIETVWERVDHYIAPDVCEGLPINIITDTAAILHRAEIAGYDVAPERWRKLSEYAASNFPDPGQSFIDVHTALAHAMAGDNEKLAKFAENPKGFAGDLVVPIAKAWQAIAREDWTGALVDLTPVMAQTARLGGSRAQRDLLELTFFNALLKTGQRDEANRMIQMRRPMFAGHVPVAGA